MIAVHSQGRRTKLSRKKKYKITDQLPIISKTALTLKSQSNHHSYSSFVDKINWVLQNTDYSLLTNQDIALQFNKLKRQLFTINLQVSKHITNVDLTKLKKYNNHQKSVQKFHNVQQKQTTNNTQIQYRLKQQYCSLQKRIDLIQHDNKNNIQDKIAKTRLTLQKIKKKIKDLKYKNMMNGNSIINQQDRYEQIHLLQVQKKITQTKKIKLQSKTIQIQQKLYQSQFNLQQINHTFLKAQHFSNLNSQKNKFQSHQQQLTKKFNQLKQYLSLTSHKNYSNLNHLQQKYHFNLKSLQSTINRLSTLSQKIFKIQQILLNDKQRLQKLAILYKKNQQKIAISNPDLFFYTELQQHHLQINQHHSANNNGNHQITPRDQQNSNINLHLSEIPNSPPQTYNQQPLVRKQSLNIPATHQSNPPNPQHFPQSHPNNLPSQSSPRKHLQTNNSLDIFSSRLGTAKYNENLTQQIKLSKKQDSFDQQPIYITIDDQCQKPKYYDELINTKYKILTDNNPNKNHNINQIFQQDIKKLNQHTYHQNNCL